MIWVRRFCKDPLRTLCRLQNRHGDAIVLADFLRCVDLRRRCIVAIGPQYNELILGNPAVFRTTGQMIRGGPNSAVRRIRLGLTAMNGPEHRQQRQLIAPYFSKKAIASYYDRLLESSEQIISGWPAGRYVDISKLAQHLMMRLSTRVLFGRGEPEQMEKLGYMIHDMIQWNPLVQFFPLKLPGLPMWHLFRDAEQLEQVMLNIFRDAVRIRPLKTATCSIAYSMRPIWTAGK